MSNPTPRPIMILLTGGRSTPAVMGALAVQPRAVEFINSADQPGREEEVRSALASLSDLEETGPGITVDAYDMGAVVAVCEMLVQRHKEGPFVVNLSAGTKVMALGAYEFARERQIPALYVDTGGGRVLDLTTDQTFPTPPMDVIGYLACFGRTPHWTFDEGALSLSLAEAVDAATALVHRGEAGLRVLEQIRRHGEGKGRRTKTIKKYVPSSDEMAVWKELVSLGLLDGVQNQNGSFRFTLKNDADHKFLEGTWLEIYAWNAARQQRDKEGNRLFHDVQFSFEIPSDTSGGRKEIDVGLMVAGQLIHCSCKAGSTRVWSTVHLDELRAVSSLIGGRFCSRIFITSMLASLPGDDSRRSYDSFLAQAADREVVVIKGDQLPQLGELLAKEADDPTYKRI